MKRGRQRMRYKNFTKRSLEKRFNEPHGIHKLCFEKKEQEIMKIIQRHRRGRTLRHPPALKKWKSYKLECQKLVSYSNLKMSKDREKSTQTLLSQRKSRHEKVLTAVEESLHLYQSLLSNEDKSMKDTSVKDPEMPTPSLASSMDVIHPSRRNRIVPSESDATLSNLEPGTKRPSACATRDDVELQVVVTTERRMSTKRPTSSQGRSLDTTGGRFNPIKIEDDDCENEKIPNPPSSAAIPQVASAKGPGEANIGHSDDRESIGELQGIIKLRDEKAATLNQKLKVATYTLRYLGVSNFNIDRLEQAAAKRNAGKWDERFEQVLGKRRTGSERNGEPLAGGEERKKRKAQKW